MHGLYRGRYKDLVRTEENKRVYIDHKAVTESFSRGFFFDSYTIISSSSFFLIVPLYYRLYITTDSRI